MPPRISLSFEELEDFLQLAALQAVPVRIHRDLHDRVRQNRRRPFDRVDLGHQRRVDEARFGVELSVAPRRVLTRQQIAHVVVLEREERVEHRQPDPPVIGEPAEMHARLWIDGQEPGRLQLELAAFAGPHSSSRRRTTSRTPAMRPTSGCSGWRTRAGVSKTAGA